MRVREARSTGEVGRTGRTGQGAPSLKYDLVTALLAMGQHDPGPARRLAPRLALLITARYNWRSGTLAVGQREIARLWGVTERTAKREMATMRERGWIAVRRPAARGRVTEHALDLPRLLDATRPVWSAVGPDFVVRMGAGETVDHPPGEEGATVVPFPRVEAEPLATDAGLWPSASALLRRQDPALYATWFSRLHLSRHEGPHVALAASSAFVASYVETHYGARLLDALRALNPGIREVRVICVP